MVIFSFTQVKLLDVKCIGALTKLLNINTKIIDKHKTTLII